MQNVCRLSQRWHQQFCRSPSFAGHRQCLQNFQPVREYRQVIRSRPLRQRTSQVENHVTNPSISRSTADTDNIIVREYEPDARDRSKLNRINPNEEITDEMAETKMELAKLERELELMRQGPFGPQSEFMQSLPKDEREQLLKTLADEGLLREDQEDLLNMAELDRLADEEENERELAPRKLGVTLKIPRKDQAYIRYFNQALQTAEQTKGLDVQCNLNLWRWYLRCQQQVHNFSSIVSVGVWQFLWQSQKELKIRPKHLVVLAGDMLEAKVAMEPDQWLSYIEALHADGSTEAAINIWEDRKSHLRTMPQVSRTFWQIGVQMYAKAGQPLKAQELALNALKSGKAEPSILIPVIVAWAKSPLPDALVKAWACYLKLRESAGNAMLPELYERVSNAFLDADQGDMALSVFKDMLLMKQALTKDSKAVYHQAEHHFSDVLQNATTEEQINQIGLTALLVLPRQFQNRFFFTSWIKKLIGEKRVDSASMVVELMYERGIAPDAKPLNGIIGAWLREGTVSAQQKAEDMAWAMVEARADFVARRSATSANEGQQYRKVVLDDRDQSVRRRVPSATIETFSILLQHYTRRQDHDQAEKLTDMMVNSCQIRPNSYIMNHWLFGDLRAGQLQLVWDKYCNLKRDITPDMETFAALWDTAKVQYSRADSAHAKSFPSARELFAEMNDWLSTLTPKKAAIAREDFSAELYEQVIRCFCLSKDLPGTLLALQHMARLFECYPTDNAVRLVCGQASRLLPQGEQASTRTSRTRRSVARNRSVMSQVGEIIEVIETKQKMALLEQGVDAESIENHESTDAQQLRLSVLTEFICMFMHRAQAASGSYRNDVKIAAQSMHVDFEDINLDVSS